MTLVSLAVGRPFTNQFAMEEIPEDYWTDPAFPRAFPWAGEARFWEGYVGDLRVQCEQLADPPLLG